MDTDIYSPIDVRNGEIRLLLLAPGAPHEQISGALIHTKVNDRRQKYEALSYTWGSSELKTPITINGCPCLVNINLLAALIELRSDGEERLLWIDAICINQEDVVEKGVHVPLMHHVYQNASQVIVWLGCASDDSDQALLHTDILLQERSVHGFIKRLACSGTAAARRTMSGNIWRPLAAFFHRQWWMRMWVAQEIFYGASEAIVMCGGTSRPWENIIITSAILAKDSDHIIEMAPQMPSAVLAGIARSSSAFELFQILSLESLTLQYALENVARMRYATDARDKVYALLNMLPASERPCEADYSIDVNVLYTKVALHIMRKSGNLNVLSSCATSEWIHTDLHMREGFKTTTPLQGLPSWVPDWTVPRITVPCTSVLDTQSHDHLRLLRSPDPSPFRLEGDQVLVVRGIIRGSIVAISHDPMLAKATSLFGPSDLKSFIDYVRWHMATVVASSSSRGKDMYCTAVDAEWSLLTGDSTRSSRPLNYSKHEYTSWRKTGFPPPSPEFKALAMNRLMCRRVSSTSEGLLALVPWGVKVQDCISLVIGCYIPIILRPILIEARNEKGKDVAQVSYHKVIGGANVERYSAEDILHLSGTETGGVEELRLK